MTMQVETPKEIIELEQHLATVSPFLTLQVIDGGTQRKAGTALTKVRNQIKETTKIQDYLIEPNKTAIARIKEQCNRVLFPLRMIESHIASQLSAYANMLEAARVKAQAHQDKLQENRDVRAEEKGIERPLPEMVAPQVVAAPKTISTDAGKLTMRENWHFVVTKELDIPREYLTINQTALNAVARAFKDHTLIPGGYAKKGIK